MKTFTNSFPTHTVYTSTFTKASGFMPPENDHAEKGIDLNKTLVRHPSATFLVQVKQGNLDSMGIFAGDKLVVDRSLTPTRESLVIADVDGELKVKHLQKIRNKLFIVPENGMDPIRITAEMNFQVWGVVTNVIRQI